jgi:hypothetical protein
MTLGAMLPCRLNAAEREELQALREQVAAAEQQKQWLQAAHDQLVALAGGCS